MDICYGVTVLGGFLITQGRIGSAAGDSPVSSIVRPSVNIHMEVLTDARVCRP